MLDNEVSEKAWATYLALQKRKQLREARKKREADDFKASQITKSSTKYRIGQL